MEISKNFAEIERKFLLKDTYPSTLSFRAVQVLRTYIFIDSGVELRIQRKDNAHYELERKVTDAQSPLRRWSMKASITAAEFQKLQGLAIGHSISYLKHQLDIPGISIKEYLDQLAGFAIVEIEFKDLQSAPEFHPSHPWIGPEITHLPFSRDSGLIHTVNFAGLAPQLPTS